MAENITHGRDALHCIHMARNKGAHQIQVGSVGAIDVREEIRDLLWQAKEDESSCMQCQRLSSNQVASEAITASAAV